MQFAASSDGPATQRLEKKGRIPIAFRGTGLAEATQGARQAIQGSLAMLLASWLAPRESAAFAAWLNQALQEDMTGEYDVCM